ncbi:hypothetical protein TI04_08185 [Achromatium sp. WMS2]|nr:hypothetical protein TI04_08185 [Achromatium sp. WMS2]
MQNKYIRNIIISIISTLTLQFNPAAAFTVYSIKDSFMGPGIFYGPGRLADSLLFDVVIRNVAFTSAGTFVTPFFNNGAAEPNVRGEIATTDNPDGYFSDGTTPINENADVGPFELSGSPFLVGIGGGGAHQGEQISVLLDNHLMIMTMDIVFDMGIGPAGVISAPFYGTTGEATLPPSIQTKLGYPGGIDRAGSLKAGDKIRGRLGDFDGNGMLDGAIVVTGNLPLNSIFMPGAPYALIRYFETDMPYNGALIGKLPGTAANRHQQSSTATHAFPEAETAMVSTTNPGINK